MLKILIIDDHALFRAGLRLLLTSMEHTALILEAATLSEANTNIRQHPDITVCLLDLMLVGERGLDAIATIKDAATDAAIVIVSATNDFGTVHACIDAGAMSFVSKSMQPATLTLALQKVLAGQIYLPEEFLTNVAVFSDRPSLSPRQIDVLRGLARGLPTKSIARNLLLSEYTVKEYIGRVFETLNVHNRTEAVITAGRLGLLELPRPQENA
jgi:two-component system nitrate/nitrite response regulator NarL